MTPRRTIAALALVAGAALSAAAQTATPPAPAATPAAPAASQPGDSALEARTREVASQLRCPVCQGLSIQESPSELSQEMKGLVREQLRAGKTPDEVKQYFIARYGEWILLDPQAHGFNWVVYLAPVALLVVGAGALIFAVKRWSSGAAAPPSEPRRDDEEAETGIA